ncbi:cytochrome P450 [Proteobacteria bacterium 005FR1]|nr:cytochrome P450 [Proteobacteria bacterium 005FR1]
MIDNVIPQPRPDPLLKNLRELNPAAPVQSLMRLADIHGPLFRLELPNRSMLVVSSQELVNEVCDESRFQKRIHKVLQHLRDLAGDGLFTAYKEEPNWARAHRILLPAFGPMAIRGMFDQMLDIADQMLLRWERFGENEVIDVADQMTRLTLDTIALCGFDYRFNSFYQPEMHPFIDSMVDGLAEAGARARRPNLLNRMMVSAEHRYLADIELMHRVADQVIAERRADPKAAEKNDLLNRMLTARDPVSGEKLSDENIRYQMVTFLIAGHETTSGLLSFAVYLLLKNPKVLQQAQATVDRVLGAEMPRPEHRPGLRYIEQVLMETLRLWPTAPAFGLSALEETVIGGRYPVSPREVLMVLIPSLHRDKSVWGADVEVFRPERFDPERERQLPPNAWKPFGNGERACIGRPFAMQEAVLVLSMVLQRFELIEHDPDYKLEIKETLTLKPEGFRIRVRRRGSTEYGRRSHVVQGSSTPGRQKNPQETATSLQPLLLLYGSNTGASESFARRVCEDAGAHGFRADIAPLDEYSGKLPARGAVIIVTASYEGQPPDNARRFVDWLGDCKPGDLAGVSYAVFGCGNRQWASTYQAVPIRIDERLEASGASRIMPRGEADANGDFLGAFDAWYEDLWTALGSGPGKQEVSRAKGKLEVRPVQGGRASVLRQSELQSAQIVENRELVDMSAAFARSKRHLEIALPEGMRYRSGDYLVVLPRNPNTNVERVLCRFGFAADTLVEVNAPGGTASSLPTGQALPVSTLLSDYVELAQPATRLQVAALAEASACPPEREALSAMTEETTYSDNVLAKRLSVLDLLERFPSCEIDFGAFLEMLPPLRPRQYSISSSPLWKADHCTLTFSVVDAPALSGRGRHLGVASSHLAAAAPGSRISAAVRSASPGFRPPEDLQTPMVLIAAGAGIAPFRGFLQERAIQARTAKVGRSLLFFGCSDPGVDYLYRDELMEWQSAGIVELRPAFSKAPEGEVRYVQDRLWHDRAELAELMLGSDARIYVCGDGERMAPAVRETLIRIYQEVTACDLRDARRWLEEMRLKDRRYAEDIFA